MDNEQLSNITKKRIKEQRERYGWTQEEVATKMGITRSAYTNFEIGRRDIDRGKLGKLADIFDVSVDFLLGLTDTPNSQEKQSAFTEEGEIEDLLSIKKKLESNEPLTWEGQPLSENERRSLLATIELIFSQRK